MKHLYNKLKESILDDEDEIIDNMADDLYNVNLKDSNSPFRKSFKLSKDSSIYCKNGIINVIGSITHIDDIGINKYFPKVTSINVSDGINISHIPTLNNTTFIKKFSCSSIRLMACKSLEGLNITINSNNNQKSTFSTIYPFIISNSSGQITFNDVYLKFNNSNKKIHLYSPKIPIFKNVRSNAEMLLIHDENIFRNIKNELNDIFIFPYKTTVIEYGREIDIDIKNFNSLKSMISSYKYKYCGHPIFKLKNINFKDILNISTCPYLNCVIITNGIDCLQFDREGKIYNNHGNILNQTKDIYTKDGWRITLFKYKVL